MISASAFVTAPLISEQNEMQRRLDAIGALRATNETVTDNLNAALEENQRLIQEAKMHRDRTSPKNDETAFLQWANQQTNSCGFLIRDFRPSIRGTQGNYVTRTVILSTEGSYDSVCRFLDKLRECPQMIRVTTFEIVPQDQSRTTFGATLNILLFSGTPQRVSNFSVSQG